MASAVEAKLRALYHNRQKGIVFCKNLSDMGHPQPKNLVHCDNGTAVGIANNTVKRQCSCSMEMNFFGDKCAQDIDTLSWHSGQENLADYQSKHHLGAHHTAVCAWYLHMENSPHFLLRSKAASALKGCVGTLYDRYLRKVPLPRAPRIKSPDHVPSHIQVTRCDNSNTGYSQVPWIPTWSDLTRLLVCLGRTKILPFMPVWLMWSLIE